MSKLTIGKVVAGLDLGDRFSWLCVLDADGEVIEEARIQTTEGAFRSWFAERAQSGLHSRSGRTRRGSAGFSQGCATRSSWPMPATYG